MLAPIGRLVIRYDGHHAVDHMMDMAELGQSLSGIAKILNSASHLTITGELPRRKGSIISQTLVSAPIQRCVLLDTIIQYASTGLGFVPQVLAAVGPEAMHQLAKIALLAPASTTKETDDRIAQVLPLIQEINRSDETKQEKYLKAMASMSEQETDRLRLITELQERNFNALAATVKEFAYAMARPAAEAVEPIGKSVDRLIIGRTENDHITEINAELAEKIKSSEKLEIGGLQEFIGVVRGLIDYNSTLRIALNGDDKWIVPCDLVDPAGMGEGSLYYEAFGNKRPVKVKAKPHIRDGEIKRLTIIDAQWANP